MSIVREVESRSKEPFDRAACIQSTTNHFIPSVYSLGRGIEERYLGDDLYTTGEGLRSVTRIHSVDLALAQRLAQIGDSRVALTDDRLQAYITQAEQPRKAWVVAVANRARQLGLVKNVTPKEADTKVETYLLTSLAELLFEVDFLGPKGWSIFPSKQGEDPILLIHPEGGLTLDLVALDALHQADPDFLHQQIVNYHKAEVMSSLAFSINHNLGYHGISPTELLPEFVRELGKLDSEDRQAKEVNSMLLFLNYLMWLGTTRPRHNLFAAFKDKVSNLGARMPNGRIAYIGGYLAHLSACPSEASEIRFEYSRLEAAYKRLSSYQSSWKTEAGRFSDRQRHILAHPARVVTLLMEETRVRQDREIDEAFGNFVTNTAGVNDQGQLLEALRQQLPDIHGRFIQLGEWLGTDYTGISRLGAIISEVARTISFGGLGTTLAQLQEASSDLGHQLSLRRGEFKDICIDQSGKIMLLNPHLQGVISLFAIKSAQVDFEGKKQDMLLADFYKRKVAQCRELTKALAAHFREEAEEKTSILLGLEENKQLFDDLKSQIGITDEEITSLFATTGKDFQKYNFDFSLLFLHRQGLIDMHSSTFQAFLRFYFPSFQES